MCQIVFSFNPFFLGCFLASQIASEIAASKFIPLQTHQKLFISVAAAKSPSVFLLCCCSIFFLSVFLLCCCSKFFLSVCLSPLLLQQILSFCLSFSSVAAANSSFLSVSLFYCCSKFFLSSPLLQQILSFLLSFFSVAAANSLSFFLSFFSVAAWLLDYFAREKGNSSQFADFEKLLNSNFSAIQNSKIHGFKDCILSIGCFQ